MSPTCTRYEEGSSNFAIPIIDMGRLGLDHNPEALDSDWERVGKDLLDAFERAGFAYISGHGLSMTKVARLQRACEDFFVLPDQEKSKYKYRVLENHGYAGINSEKCNSEYGLEFHESYNIRSAKNRFFPDKTVPDLRLAADDFLESSLKLIHRLLKVLAVGLDLPRDFFLKNHSSIGQDENRSIGRVIHYPPVPETTAANTIRLGEHSDFGTFTLIFQDGMGGLQVRDSNSDWKDATPIAGTVVVNVGDILEFWTGGRIKATKHRVVIPEDEIASRQPRVSTVSFIYPDDSTIIQPINASSWFEPITAKQHVVKRHLEIFES